MYIVSIKGFWNARYEWIYFFHYARYTVSSILRYNILHATVNLVNKKDDLRYVLRLKHS